MSARQAIINRERATGHALTALERLQLGSLVAWLRGEPQGLLPPIQREEAAMLIETMLVVDSNSAAQCRHPYHGEWIARGFGCGACRMTQLLRRGY